MIGRFDGGSLGTRGAVDSYWLALGRRDPNLSTVRVVVTVVLGDRTIRAATEPVQATSGRTGQVFDYRPILDAEPLIDLAVSLGSRAPTGRSFAVSLRNVGIDLSDLLVDAKPIGGDAEIALVVDGMDHDLRLVIVRGVVEGGVTFRLEGEALTVTITDPIETAARSVPPQVVDLSGWVHAHESAVGQRVARVYNEWANVPAVRVRDVVGGTGPAFAVCDDPDRLTISEVRVNGEVKASGDATYPWSEEVLVSSRGDRVLAVDFGTSGATWEDSDSVHVSVERRVGVRTMGVLDVLTHLLRSTSLGPAALRPDLFAVSGARLGPSSPVVLINASGPQTVNVRDAIGPLLDGWPGLHLVYEQGGLGPIVLDRRFEVVRGVAAELVGGTYPLLDRGVVEETPRAGLLNDLEVRYDFDSLDDHFVGFVRRNADNSARAATSEAFIGRRTSDVAQLQYVGSATDAGAAADWMIEHLSLPWYYLEWTCPASAFLRFRRGQSVIYTDPDLSALSEVRALVVRVSYQRGRTTLGLLVWAR